VGARAAAAGAPVVVVYEAALCKALRGGLCCNCCCFKPAVRGDGGGSNDGGGGGGGGGGTTSDLDSPGCHAVLSRLERESNESHSGTMTLTGAESFSSNLGALAALLLVESDACIGACSKLGTLSEHETG
jgi:hypothetical protein